MAAAAAAWVGGGSLTAAVLRRWPASPALHTQHPLEDHTMTRTGPRWSGAWMVQQDCPACPCCTAELCRQGSASGRGCRAHTPAEHQQTVSGCPCSTGTAGTFAWPGARTDAAAPAQASASETGLATAHQLTAAVIVAGGGPW